MTGFAPDLFAGRRYWVIGLGRNGLPAVRALIAMGAEILAWDDDAAIRSAAAAEGVTLRDPGSAAIEASALVLSPGIPHRLPVPHPVAERASAAGVPILTDAELLFEAVRRGGSRARFAGVTGTNGKSTTTALLAHILAGAGVPIAAGGNLGPAALALPALGDDGVYVLEMSSYMLERIATLRFDVATMLNLSADHLDRHGDMAGYARAKRAIFARQGADDTAVVGIDDPTSRDMADDLTAGPARLRRISGESHADIWCDRGILRDGDGALLDMRMARALPGAHNAQNAAAAAAMAQALGVARADIAAGTASFPGLLHRQQLIVEIDGVAYINDSKATNADAAARALGCYDRIFWIVGGIAKAGGIEPLAASFPRIVRAFVIGRDAPAIAGTLARHGVAHDIVQTLEAAVPAAAAAARRQGGGIVLLSPACASFDQFGGFEARGARFAELVRALAYGEAA